MSSGHWFGKELLRAKEFASSARNGPAALLALLPLRSYFNLLRRVSQRGARRPNQRALGKIDEDA